MEMYDLSPSGVRKAFSGEVDGPDTLRRQIRRFALTPGYQLCYALGMFEIEGLRSRFSSRLGFKDFHAVLLHGGQLPVELAAERLAATCEAHEKARDGP